MFAATIVNNYIIISIKNIPLFLNISKYNLINLHKFYNNNAMQIKNKQKNKSRTNVNPRRDL